MNYSAIVTTRLHTLIAAAFVVGVALTPARASADCGSHNYDQGACQAAGCNFGGDGRGSNECWAGDKAPEMPQLLLPVAMAGAYFIARRSRRKSASGVDDRPSA